AHVCGDDEPGASARCFIGPDSGKGHLLLPRTAIDHINKSAGSSVEIACRCNDRIILPPLAIDIPEALIDGASHRTALRAKQRPGRISWGFRTGFFVVILRSEVRWGNEKPCCNRQPSARDGPVCSQGNHGHLHPISVAMLLLESGRSVWPPVVSVAVI